MIPGGMGPARRPHADSPADDADPNEDARRVRPRTQEAGPGDALSGLSPRGAPPGGSPPESPRRSLVSAQQLQQWHGSTGPRSPGQASPASLTAVAQAGTSSSRPPGAVQPAAFDAMQAIPPEGRNTLVVYAVAQHLGEAGTLANALKKARSALIQFGSALLRERPPLPLNEFLDRLHSPEPAERDAAAALKGRLTSEPGFVHMQYGLRVALDALPNIPPERRMLTLQQALHSRMQAPALKTLLPTADLDLLQQVQDFDRDLSPVAAGENQVLLIRLGIALMAEGHGGLAGWLEMHNQPEGSRLANELLERVKNGPELALNDRYKNRLGQAAARLRASALGEGGGSSGAALAPRFPADFPPAEASLIDACLQAGLDKGLSRATLYRYGRELIGLSEWLRQPADADRPAQPTGLRALRDLSEAGQRDLVAEFIARRPISSVTTNAAVGLLLTLPAPVPGPAGTPAATPQPALASPSVPLAASAEEAAAGPSAAAASPSTSAWSLESAYERVGGAEGIQAWLREIDEVMSSYQPGVSTPAGTSQAFDLDAHYRQLTADDSTGALLQNLGGAMARAHPEAETVTETSAAGESAPVAGPPNAAAPDAAPAVHSMPAEAAVQWFNSRLQDIQMASLAHGQLVRAELLLFADHLAEGPGASALQGLNGFLQRYESSDPSLRRAARAELQQYLGPQGRSARMAGRRDPVVIGLDSLVSVPAAQRLWADPATRISQDRVGNMNKRRLLPPQDRALLERVNPAQRFPLARFARAMLSEGHGGLAHWLLMFREGRGQQARQLMLDFNAANRGRLSQPGSQLLAASGVRAVAPELPGPSARVPSPGSPRRPSVPAEPLQQWHGSTGPRSPGQAAADLGPAGMQAWMQEMDRMFSHRAGISTPAGPSQAFGATGSGLSRAGEGRPAIPVGLGSARRPHPDSAADPNEESRRVRPRTQEAGPGDAPSGLSPRGAPPESPRRSFVSAQQLQQRQGSTGPRSPGQVAAGAPASGTVLAQASASSSRPRGAVQPAAFDAMQAIPPEGRNTLVAYALEKQLGDDRAPPRQVRRALIQFGSALLRQQPPVPLNEFLDRLCSPEPAERDAAAALKDRLTSEPGFDTMLRHNLKVALRALPNIPPERRMLTLEQALHLKMKAPALKTLLPEADTRLLRRVQDLDRSLTARSAGENQVHLIRLGVALSARGHGGLAGWLEMRNQPDGDRRAQELLDRFKNGPELNLDVRNKSRLVKAVARLQACGLGGAAEISAPQSGAVPLAPRFPADSSSQSPRGALSALPRRPSASAEPLQQWHGSSGPGPSASARSPESPTRPSFVSGEQLQQWRSHARPRGARQATPGAWTSLMVPAQASTSSPRPSGAAAVRTDAFDALQAVPPKGRNTLVVYAAEQVLREDGIPKGRLADLRSSLGRFGEALLQRQPPVTLDQFLNRLSSPDLMERDAAVELSDALANEHDFPRGMRYHLDVAFNALSETPSERRMLTLQQALHSTMKARALKTLLPEADATLLRQVQDFDKGLRATLAGQNQVLLIRLGIALMAEGHGGLAGWLEMHNQPEGSGLANELLERVKSGPELALNDRNKNRLGQAAARLRASALGEGGGSSGAALAPRFPADFPPAEASLTDACLQAGLDKGLSRNTLYKYGRDLIGLSEWLRQPADADRPAQPTGLHALRDLSEAGQRDLVAAFIASRPAYSDTVNAAVRLLLTLPASVPGPAGTSTPQPALASPSVPFAASAEEAAAGPSAAAASPSTSAWSLESAYERIGGAEGIQAWLREVDEVMSGYQPDVSAPAGPSRAIDLASQYRQLTADDSTAALLQNLGGAMARAHPEAEAATEASAAGESAPVAGPPNAAAPDAAPAMVHAMPAEAAVQWFNSRLQDIQMALSVHQQFWRAELLLFADHLAEGPGASALQGLNGFLQRYESSDPSLRRAARAELQQYLRERSAVPTGRPDRLVSGLDLLAKVPAAQRLWTHPGTRISEGRVNNRLKGRLLPPQDRALLERVNAAQRPPLARFARAMLSEGQGGLTHWLLMFGEGRGQQARQLMLDFNITNKQKFTSGVVSLTGDPLLAADTRFRTAQPSSSTAPSQDDPLQGFAESLERSLASPSPEPGTRQRDAVPAAAASPGARAMEDILADPGTPTAGDFAFLTDPFGPGHGGDSIQDPWSDLHLTDDEPDRPATPPDGGR